MEAVAKGESVLKSKRDGMSALSKDGKSVNTPDFVEWLLYKYVQDNKQLA